MILRFLHLLRERSFLVFTLSMVIFRASRIASVIHFETFGMIPARPARCMPHAVLRQLFRGCSGCHRKSSEAPAGEIHGFQLASFEVTM